VSAELQPTTRLQFFLAELKTTLCLLKEVLLELKEVLVVVGLILFFVLGVYSAIKHYFL
jgi:hypothetical protein